MFEIAVPVLYMLSGVCGFSGAYFLVEGLRRPRRRAMLLFALIGLLTVPFALFQIASYRAESLPEYVSALRAELGTICVLYVALSWFIAGYTRVFPRCLPWLATAFAAVFFVVNLQAPLTLQYVAELDITRHTLPWGETVTRGTGESGWWFRAGAASVFAVHGIWLYSLFLGYRRSRKKATLVLGIAMTVQTLAIIEGVLAREGLIPFLYLGPLGMLSLVITMSLVLGHESWHRLRFSENRFRQLVEQCPLSIQVCEPDGRVSLVNPGWVRLWGKSAKALIDYNLLEDPQLLKKGAMPFIRAAFSGKPSEMPPLPFTIGEPESPSEHRRDRWICAHIYPVKDDKNRLSEVILIHEDITDRKYADDAIRYIAGRVSAAGGTEFFQQLVQNLALLFEATCAYIAVREGDSAQRLRIVAMAECGRIASVQSFDVTGTPSARVLENRSLLVPHDVQRHFPNDPMLARLGAQSYAGTALKDSHDRVIGVVGIVSGKPLEFTGQMWEILTIFAARAGTELQRLEAEAATLRMARVDYVTGLATRPYLHQRLVGSLAQARSAGRYSSILLMDLDHFKMINDALGHDTGDMLLRAVGQRIEAAARGAFVARFGGDEFVVLLDTQTDDMAAAQTAAKDLEMRVTEQMSQPVVVGDRTFSVGASMGIVVYPTDEQNELDVLRHADIALNLAKKQGRGRAKLYAPGLQTLADDRLKLDDGLRDAIRNGELALYFQPQVDAAGNVSGTEALLRWRHPLFKEVGPDAFIVVAEETGLIHTIGRWTLDQACALLAAWQRQGVGFGRHLAVNVSAWQFVVPDFVEQVRQIVNRHGADPHRLILELTETALLYDLNDSIAKMQELRAFGVSISLDDFGTGYSSLAYLKDLPLDQIKIDKSFVEEIDTATKAPLVNGIITIGRNMNLTIVAEGVETQRQKELLETMGDVTCQGYLYTPALPEPAFREWLLHHSGPAPAPKPGGAPA